MPNAAITGVAGFLPEDTLTNQDLEKIVDTNDAWIRERTGIVNRHILKGEGKGTSSLMAPAVAELLKQTGTRPEDVELLITCTISGDFHFPDTAAIVAHKLGMVNAYGFDLGAACSGFLYGLSTGVQFIRSGTHRKVIVVGGDKMSSIIDYTDRTTCILFGDGAGAVMLEPTEADRGVLDFYHRSDGSGASELYMLAGGSVNPASHETIDKRMHYLFQNGRTVYKKAVLGMADSIRTLLERNNMTADDIAWVVPHQANLRIIEAVAKQLDFPMERVTVNIHKYGNTTAATIPLCLRDYQDQFKPGDNLILTAFGGGYTMGATLLRWGS